MHDLSLAKSVDPYAVQLVFFDIDGTLLSTEGHYSALLATQIQRLHHQGIKTAIASGRPSYAARFLIDELSINNVGVFCTGAEVYDPQASNHLSLHTLETTIAYQLYQRAKMLGLYCELYSAEQYYIDAPCELTQLHSQHLRVQPIIVDGEQVFEQGTPLIKLLLGRDKNSHSPPLALIAKEFSELEFAFAHFLARPDWEFASVISPAANKQSAFDQVLKHYQIPASAVMAIGDSHSDMVFIERAGVGVAMANASAEVKAVANYITLTADEDGVAFALEKLVR